MNVDFVPVIRGVRVLCKPRLTLAAAYIRRSQSKPRLIFSRINGPNIKIEDEVSK